MLRPIFGALLVMATTTAAHAEPDFTARLHERLKSQSGNLFYSPLSIRMALSMAYAGAGGETAAEMRKTLGLGADAHADNAKVLAAWRNLAEPVMPNEARTSRDPQMQPFSELMQRSWEEQLESRRVIVRIANRLWAQEGRAFREPFLKTLSDNYSAPLQRLDFKSAPEPSRQKINTWVSDATEQKIRNLLSPGTITNDTKLIITNAIYFKASWQNPFRDNGTKPAPFHLAGSPPHVPTMHVNDHFQHASFAGGQILEMRYGAGDLAMDVILPDANDGLATVEKSFIAGALTTWIGALKTRLVDVSLPSFKTTSRVELTNALGAMGMKKAFLFPGADFEGIDGTRELFISKVIHQAFVAVDEKGTEAAAATAGVMLEGAAPQPEKTVIFRADRPFLFVIRDTNNGEVLFVGRIVDPR